MRTQIDPKANGSNREDFERRQLLSELNSLNDNRTILRQKLGLLREHAQQFESNIEREKKRKAEIERKYDEQINQLRSSIEDYVSEIVERPRIDLFSFPFLFFRKVLFTTAR